MGRFKQSLIAAALFSAAMFGAGVSPSNAADSVAYQNNAAHNGAVLEAAGLPTPLKQRWSVNVGGASSYPLIAESMVFVTVANTSGSGTRLLALDIATGNTVWTKAIGGTYRWSNAAFDRGYIFLVNDSGLLQAFVARTGAPLWTVQLAGQYFFTSPPTAINSVVYVGGAGDGGTLYAVSENTGTVLWTQGVENGDNSSPAVNGSGVYVSYPCQVYRFSPAGKLDWNYNGGCEGGGGKTPVLYRGDVYVRDPGESSLILNEVTGAIVGSLAAVPAPAFWGDVMMYLDNGVLTGQSVTTGNQLWTFRGDGGLTSAPLVVNGIAYVGSSSGNLYGLHVSTGKISWSTNVGAAIPAPDEQNVSQPLTGFGAGDGTLVIPAGSLLVAYWSK